jgi:hypothetical protein
MPSGPPGLRLDGAKISAGATEAGVVVLHEVIGVVEDSGLAA